MTIGSTTVTLFLEHQANKPPLFSLTPELIQKRMSPPTIHSYTTKRDKIRMCRAWLVSTADLLGLQRN